MDIWLNKLWNQKVLLLHAAIHPKYKPNIHQNFISYLCIITSYIKLYISAANCIVDTGDGFDVLFKRKSNNLNIFENKARSLNIKNCQVMSGFEMNGGSNKIQV